MNVLAAEMEASIIFVLARLWGLRAGGIAVVLDNVCEAAGESGQFDPQEALAHSESYINNLTLAGCETIRILFEKDSKNRKL